MTETKFNNGTLVIPTCLQDCFIIQPKVFGDSRGYFSPYFLQEYMAVLGFEKVVQTNRSLSSKGVLRGLHFQRNPYAQAKIVEVISGAAIDVVVDIRKNSPTYGKGTAVLLKPYNPEDPESGKQLFVPRGFAHGFVSLEDNTLFQYLIDNDYNIQSEDGILWNDENLDIDWNNIFETYGINPNNLLLSEKDSIRTPLKDNDNDFVYVRRR